MTATSLPLSAQELCESVRQSLAFDASRLDRVLQVDTSRGLVEVQAATRWKDLAAHLRPGDARARELRTTRSTVAESIAWNAAGPDGRPTVSHVESLTMITPDGQLRRIDRISNAGLFALVVGGQGLFGAIYSVTLRLESLARAVSDAELPETLLQPASAASTRKLYLLVPPGELQGLIDDSHERCAQWRIALGSMQTRRIRPEDETFLRWAGREYMQLALGIPAGATLCSQVRTRQLKRELIDLAIAHGGRFPISCTREATRAQAEACYPQLADFLSEQRRVDPHERWSNAWLRHHRSLLGREACEVRFAH